MNLDLLLYTVSSVLLSKKYHAISYCLVSTIPKCNKTFFATTLKITLNYQTLKIPIFLSIKLKLSVKCVKYPDRVSPVFHTILRISVTNKVRSNKIVTCYTSKCLLIFNSSTHCHCCGYGAHNGENACQATKSKFRSCGDTGHWDNCYVKSGNVFIAFKQKVSSFLKINTLTLTL